MTRRGIVVTIVIVAIASLAGVARLVGSADEQPAAAPSAPSGVGDPASSPDTPARAGTASDAATSDHDKLAPATATSAAPAGVDLDATTDLTPIAQRRVRNAAVAVRAYARSYINWSAATLVTTYRRLAGRSDGDARRVMLELAERVRSDAQMRAADTANEGTVEVVRQLKDERFLLVTDEHSRVNGRVVDGSQRFATYLATVKTTRRGVAVTTWEPQR